VAWGIVFGGSIGFIIFELSHQLIHNGTIEKHWLIYPLWDYHMGHHKNVHFGYTFIMPFWDILFNTVPPTYKYAAIPLPVPIIPFILAALLDRYKNQKNEISH
jgi:sterol desaturase/sphingolipid hydroxylase (fatty acid hydroxylase superfamily)